MYQSTDGNQTGTNKAKLLERHIEEESKHENETGMGSLRLDYFHLISVVNSSLWFN